MTPQDQQRYLSTVGRDRGNGPPPTPEALAAEAAIHEAYEVGTSSRFCDDPPDLDTAPDGALARIIDAAGVARLRAERDALLAACVSVAYTARCTSLGPEGSCASQTCEEALIKCGYDVEAIYAAELEKAKANA